MSWLTQMGSGTAGQVGGQIASKVGQTGASTAGSATQSMLANSAQSAGPMTQNMLQQAAQSAGPMTQQMTQAPSMLQQGGGAGVGATGDNFWQSFGNYIENNPNTAMGAANMLGGAGYQEDTQIGPLRYNQSRAQPNVNPGVMQLLQLASSFSGRR